MRTYNHNIWTDAMQSRMNELIESFGIEKRFNKYGEPTLNLSSESKKRLGVIAEMMNREFDCTLSFSSVANRYHISASSKEQLKDIRARRKAYEMKRNQRAKEHKVEQTQLALDEPTPTPAPTNIRIADVIIKCGRLVSEDKMTPEELYNLIDTL